MSGMQPPTFTALITTAANVAGMISGTSQYINLILPFVLPALGGGTTANDTVTQVNTRIALLQSYLTQQIENVGDQIKQQIQDLDNFVKGQTVVQLLTQAKTALSELHDYYAASDPSTKGPLLAQADQNASYVSLYVQQSPNLSYLPALGLGGGVRLDIIRVLNPQYRNDPVYMGEIHNLISLLQQQITTVSTNVTNSHTVAGGRQILSSFTDDLGKPVVVYGNYLGHFSKGKLMQTFPYGPAWATYGNITNPMTQAQATTAAQNAVGQGISDELNFLSIPTLKQALAGWEQFVSPS